MSLPDESEGETTALWAAVPTALRDSARRGEHNSAIVAQHPPVALQARGDPRMVGYKILTEAEDIRRAGVALPGRAFFSRDCARQLKHEDRRH